MAVSEMGEDWKCKAWIDATSEQRSVSVSPQDEAEKWCEKAVNLGPDVRVHEAAQGSDTGQGQESPSIQI